MKNKLKRIVFYPHHSGVVPATGRDGTPIVSFFPDFDGTLRSVKRNISAYTPNPGNLIHSESPSRIFAFDKELSSKVNLSRLIAAKGGVSPTAEFMNENYDSLVLSFANDIRRDWGKEDHQLIAELLSLLNINVSIFGLGLQAPIEGDLNELTPQLRELLLSAERYATFIGVRGKQTEDWLRSNGVSKAIALGCPSMYRHPRNVLAAINKARDFRVDMIATAGYAHSPKRHGYLNRLFSGRRNVAYIFQNDLYSVFNTEEHLNEANVFDAATNRLSQEFVSKRLHEIHKEPAPFSEYFYFTNSASWFQFSSRCDLFIGDRLHASIAALLSGTPAILLYEDARVKELADFYGIPSLKLNEADKYTPESLCELLFAPERLDNFALIYTKRLRRFHNFCRRHGFGFLNEAEISQLIATDTDS